MNSKTNSSVHMNDPTTTSIRSLISNINTHTNIHINACTNASTYINTSNAPASQIILTLIMLNTHVSKFVLLLIFSSM